MNKKTILIIIILFISCFFSVTVNGEELEKTETLIDRQLELIDLEDVDGAISQVLGEGTGFPIEEVRFSELAKKVIKGELELSPKELLVQFLKNVFKEIYSQLFFLQKMIMLAILSAVLKNINASFNGKSVGELSFYVCYIVLLVLIMNSFQMGVSLVSGVCANMVTMMEAMLPIFTALMFSAGSYMQLAFIGPVVIGAAGLLSSLVQSIVLPAVTMVTTLHMVNFISEKNILSQLSELIKSVIGWGLKGVSIAFMAIISLQKLGTPVLNKMVGKTARVAVGAVPVVGDVMSGAVELAATLSGAVSNGVAVAAIAVIIFICMVPVIKLVAMILIYKLTAALLEPICEPRLVKCISAAGDFTILLLSTLFTVEIMFIFSSIVMLSTA